MTVKRPVIKQAADCQTSSTITDFIEKGGSPSLKEDNTHRDIVFTLSIPGQLAKTIDGLRSVTKMSRRSWFLQAAQEKIQRENHTEIKFVQEIYQKNT